MPTLNSQDLELEKYFTDVEVLRDWFDKAIVAETLPKRLLVIHGVGGIGKSSLLRMFRLNCKTAHIPVALASGDEAKSAVDVLTRWAEDLKADGANLPAFFKTYEHYRAIQAKVEDETSKAQKKLGDIAGKATSKTAEAAGGAALGAALGSVIPGIGTAAGAALGGVIGGMGAEALVDYLRGFLSKPDIDLLLDPSKKLTDDFLADVNQAATSRRVVLMLDTYEQMTALDDWTREVAQQLNENILLVIAGRAMVNWGRQWSSWLMHAHVEELKPMPKRVMHELIRKYYATMRGGEPNPKQVNAIIEFSGGLPMVVNTAVQLWVKYGVEDFGAVKGEVVREVVARLREGVPAELYPLLETAAAPRYFNKDILRTVSAMGDISAGYDELRRFPFVRSRAEGYALHDRVRDMIEENVRADDPSKYRGVHERAAAYFEARMANASSEEAERLGLERLYHRVCADEESGMKLFQEMAEESARYRLDSRLQILVSEMNSVQLESENSRAWRDYYAARLSHFAENFGEAKNVYLRIAENQLVESKLRAYSLCDLGMIYRGFGQNDTAIPLFERGLSESPLDKKLAYMLFELSGGLRRKGELAKSLEARERARDFFTESHDQYGLVYALSRLKWQYLIWGMPSKALSNLNMALNILDSLPNQISVLQIEALAGQSGLWAQYGRLKQTEKEIKRALAIISKTGMLEDGACRDLGLILGFQNCFNESERYFSRAIAAEQKISLKTWKGITPGFRGKTLRQSGRFEEAEASLNAALGHKREFNDIEGIAEVLISLGELFETRAQLSDERYLAISAAAQVYSESLTYLWTGRLYFHCAALTGLVRVHHAQHNHSAIPPLLAEAEQLAQQYEYNDHLASLRLTQGHIAWDGHIPEWGKGFDAAFAFYKLALVYALRYNRFLLDEVLSGRPQGTPLHPIIPECLKRDEEGRKMLRALREWWQTGTNDVGAPRPDTISPIPENIALLEAEKIAREREPGDNSPQKSVVGQLNVALKEASDD